MMGSPLGRNPRILRHDCVRRENSSVEHLCARLAVGEIAPFLGWEGLNQRRRLVRKGGTDQIRMPGEPGSSRWERHQFDGRVLWLSANQHLFTRLHLRDDLGEFRLSFRDRDCHDMTLLARRQNSNLFVQLPCLLSGRSGKGFAEV